MPLAPEGHTLGVMLPTSNGAVVTLLAVMSAGRVPAMINFTAGAANILGACRAAQLDTILTSRTFVEKGRLEHLSRISRRQVRIVYLEDIRKTIGPLDKLRGLFGLGTSRWSRASPTTGAWSCSPPAPKDCPRASCCPTATC